MIEARIAISNGHPGAADSTSKGDRERCGTPKFFLGRLEGILVPKRFFLPDE